MTQLNWIAHLGWIGRDGPHCRSALRTSSPASLISASFESAGAAASFGHG
jgi:hypothetical protein